MQTKNTPFAVHYEKIRSLLRETAANSAKIHFCILNVKNAQLIVQAH